jgi:hypothetical protein
MNAATPISTSNGTSTAAVVAATGNIYAWLWYPVVVSALTFVVGSLFLRETKDHKIHVV